MKIRIETIERESSFSLILLKVCFPFNMQNELFHFINYLEKKKNFSIVYDLYESGTWCLKKGKIKVNLYLFTITDEYYIKIECNTKNMKNKELLELLQLLKTLYYKRKL